MPFSSSNSEASSTLNPAVQRRGRLKGQGDWSHSRDMTFYDVFATLLKELLLSSSRGGSRFRGSFRRSFRGNRGRGIGWTAAGEVPVAEEYL